MGTEEIAGEVAQGVFRIATTIVERGCEVDKLRLDGLEVLVEQVANLIDSGVVFYTIDIYDGEYACAFELDLAATDAALELDYDGVGFHLL